MNRAAMGEDAGSRDDSAMSEAGQGYEGPIFTIFMYDIYYTMFGLPTCTYSLYLRE